MYDYENILEVNRISVKLIGLMHVSEDLIVGLSVAGITCHSSLLVLVYILPKSRVHFPKPL